MKISLKRKQGRGWEAVCSLANIFFPPTTNLGFLGRSLVFRSKPFLKLSGTEEGRLGIWEGGSWFPGRCVSGAQEPKSTIMQNIMKTFHRAMKIRKYLRLSRNSRMLSPVLGSLDSSPKPCVSFFFLQRGTDSVHSPWDIKTT